jgi:hypothetical protein
MTAVGPAVPEGTRLVHIGPQKTGSTAIQVALDSAHDRLAEHGVAYVTTGSYRPRKAAWALGIRGRPSGTEMPPMRHWRRLIEAVDAADASRVCVSNEDFGRATPPQIARLVADLGGDRVRVVAVARRLDRYLPSQWQERVKAGDERPYDAWLRVVLEPDGPEPDWDRRNVWFSHDVRALVDRWTAVVSPDRFILIVSDEADHGLIPRTFEALLGLPEGFVVPDPSRSNRGLSWAETELLRETNQVLEDRGVLRAQRRPLLAAGVLRDMRARPTPPGPTSPPLPDWAADRLGALSDQRVADVRALADAGVRVIGDPELMRMPAGVPVTAPPLPLPSLDLRVAAQALASALAWSATTPDDRAADRRDGNPN